ncbi:MAG: hypothetical protein D6706_19115 [Chloroflexi bacterium]|nr:MAG: hypothetical protein D6706_19115 [Chloroflexota bacterium]
MSEIEHPFDAETWEQLPAFFENLPEPVQLTVWGDETAGGNEREAARLCRALADRFEQISWRMLPRRVNYPYYPVIGVMGRSGDEETDYGVRIIGLPAGYQLTSLITAVQAVSFHGQTLEPLTRIKLRQLPAPVNLEVVTAADNEAGALVAKIAFGMAVNSPLVRAFLIMGDLFNEVVLRYSINYLPHTIINGRIHLEGVVDEETMLKHIAKAVRPG